jgi:hypothetical protein
LAYCTKKNLATLLKPSPGGGIGWKNGEMTLDGGFRKVSPDCDPDVSCSCVTAGLSLIVEYSGIW